MPEKLDREPIYDYLWSKADGKGRLKFNQSAFARDLGVDRVTVARIMAEFVAAGKIVKIKEGHARVVLYQIVDPDVWRWRTA